ncbi:MAG: hypothetical protein DRP58_10365 [Spirochaetes bacterium]|nr:MAG: hypothetical protein DRP58_10365 [Spirochaetota bacterium]
MNWYFISFVLFFIGAALLILWKRKKITHKYYIFYRYDTKKGIDIIDKIAKISPRFWKIFGSIGVFVGFGAMFFGLNMIIESFMNYLKSPASFTPSISLVIPVPFEKLTFAPGFLGVPFWYWIIPVAVLIFFHEGMHGILARAEKIKIKNLGLFLLAIIPGAYVEPDEKQLKKASWKSKLRIYAGGSYSNIIIGLVFILFLTSFYLPKYYDGAVGFSYYTTENGTQLPARLNNMTGAIYSIDGIRIDNIRELAVVMGTKNPGEKINVKTVKGDLVAPFIDTLIIKNPQYHDYEIELADVNGEPKMGISGFSKVRISNSQGLINFITGIFVWIAILNIGVGIVNMLPIKPLDGGLMIEALGERFFPKRKEKIVNVISFLVLFILVGNILIGFL